jgi:hypothetical protein
MSEDVRVTGAPVLHLSDGGTASYDKARSSSTKLVFDYPVKSGQVTADLKVAGITLPASASIADLAGNAADLAGAGANLGLRVNTTARGEPGLNGGSSTISGSNHLEVFGASKANVTFAPGGAGTLELDASRTFFGQIAGFGGKDHIDLADISFGAHTTIGYAANAGHTGGTLTVSDGSHAATLTLLGNFMASSFAMASDGHGGTLISDQAASQHALLTQPHH